MRVDALTAVVSGGASGLGLATVRRLLAQGAHVVIVDLPSSPGATLAAEFGPRCRFVPADVTDEESFAPAFADLDGLPPLRAVVHTAGRGRPQRIVTKDGLPGPVDAFEDVLRLNVIGTYNALRLGAAAIAAQEVVEAERGAIVLTSSVAAFEGQIGQIAYATSKAAIVGMTICAARDLASRRIRVCTIAPGIFDTPLMAGVSDDIRAKLDASVPHPRRMGLPDEYAALASHLLENPYLNGETIRLDGALRMAAA
ncbi:SDR family NAD(P)-dependent oxidoreductase [Dactylosporangium sp. CA-092794]|uniref:SDR family NAD(P)-dependent oxidoreductase n=1 Tax=Dactylosporangium sp. CA-092794 TaxID=3239929 RepID=UPI003D8CB0C6